MTFSLEWKDISVTVKCNQEGFCRSIEKETTILYNVSGTVMSNTLIAVLGPSGSGKSTFLGAISGRLKDKQGTIKINDRVIKSSDLCNISGHVQQEDIFTETLTIQEHMIFTAALKLNKSVKERSAKIKKVLIDLGLEANKHTIIRTLSGGERRRLSLATELVDDPDILFFDEPTTGLDSFSAITVLQQLEAIATSGKIVLVTVHQPSSQIFDLFSDIIILAQGRLIFQGSKEQAKCFFESVNLYCPASFNPADFYMKCITGESNQ